MRDPASSRDPLAHASRVRRVARSISALAALTLGLIVLGALVRAHGAGLACPDWPRCFGVWVPVLDLRIGFEWAHRVMAGSISLLFVGLGSRSPARSGLAPGGGRAARDRHGCSRRRSCSAD